jgi:arginyl-tRNA---protein transferase
VMPHSCSKVELCGLNRTPCGYCGNTANSSVSYGVTSNNILAGDYNRMMLVGWRRSGTYLYKVTNHATCCPAYTIRVKVADYKPNKSQRQVRRRMERFLTTGDVHVATHVGCVDSAEAGDANGNNRLQVETVKAKFTRETFELYRKYQISVHRDDPDKVTEEGFTSFLCDSPLVGGDTLRAHEYEYGTYHQLYRLDGRLIAVGVIDILPTGLSSVYLIYDPADRQLALGKYSALKELDFCRDNGMPYYYMGFYIHDCEKMRYKAEYCPSELLCPTTLNWMPYRACVTKLSAGYGFVPLCDAEYEKRIELGRVPEEEAARRFKARNAAGDKGEGEGAGEGKGAAAGGRGAGSSEDRDDMLLNHSLAAFAPRFGSASSTHLDTVRFGVRHNTGLVLTDLTEPWQRVCRPVLAGFIAHCGPAVAGKVDINFK